jgi:hypothetical protein
MIADVNEGIALAAGMRRAMAAAGCNQSIAAETQVNSVQSPPPEPLKGDAVGDNRLSTVP